jgi:hypothetical protein
MNLDDNLNEIATAGLEVPKYQNEKNI